MVTHKEPAVELTLDQRVARLEKIAKLLIIVIVILSLIVLRLGYNTVLLTSGRMALKARSLYLGSDRPLSPRTMLLPGSLGIWGYDQRGIRLQTNFDSESPSIMLYEEGRELRAVLGRAETEQANGKKITYPPSTLIFFDEGGKVIYQVPRP